MITFISPSGPTSGVWFDFRLGFMHFLPVGVVILGYALVFGVLAVNSGLTVAEACLMSLTIFSGASQFIALPMIQENASIWALTAMALVINLRHLLYGLNIGRKYPEAGTWKLPGTAVKLSLINPYSLAGVVTFIISYRTKNLILSVGIGMGVFLMLGKVL